MAVRAQICRRPVSPGAVSRYRCRILAYRATPAYIDKNNVIAATLIKLINKADTSGRITKASGEGP